MAAELALAGIRSAIPADEVIWTMKKVGDVMPTALKETAEGGLAATPTGRKLHQQDFWRNEIIHYCGSSATQNHRKIFQNTLKY